MLSPINLYFKIMFHLNLTIWIRHLFGTTSPFPCHLRNRIFVNPSVKSQWEKGKYRKTCLVPTACDYLTECEWLSSNRVQLFRINQFSLRHHQGLTYTYIKNYLYKWKLYTRPILHVSKVECLEEKSLWSEVSSPTAFYRGPNSKYSSP